MKTTDADVSCFGWFDSSFRERVHQLIAWGYQDALPRIRSEDDEEPSITGFIVNAIKERLRSNPPWWCDFFFVSEEDPHEAAGRYGKSRPRTDIVIESSCSKGRPQYIFEAKRLDSANYGVSRYIGPEGMGCFIDGIYGYRYDEAGMLGYVQSNSELYWQQQVKKAVHKHSTKLGVVGKQLDLKVVAAFPIEWVSEHKRKKLGRSVRIHHILLNCCRS